MLMQVGRRNRRRLTKDSVLEILQEHQGFPFQLGNLYSELYGDSLDMRIMMQEERRIIHFLIQLVKEQKVERCCRNLYRPLVFN